MIKLRNFKEATLNDYLDKIFAIKVQKVTKIKEFIKQYDGEVGRSNHITTIMEVNLPTKYLEGFEGVMGEKRDFQIRSCGLMFGNYSIDDWIEFLKNIAKNGITNPLFITVDYNNKPKINEGNHRVQAAKWLRIETLPCEIRFFGKAEDNFKLANPYYHEDIILNKIKELSKCVN
jgi:hypothetical protein